MQPLLFLLRLLVFEAVPVISDETQGVVAFGDHTVWLVQGEEAGDFVNVEGDSVQGNSLGTGQRKLDALVVVL